ncbi:MAG: hypothetical protein HC898_10645 [Phycisphaerales bacterium]|nr:hypothetical protein [Phycisphaerales bacterium]
MMLVIVLPGCDRQSGEAQAPADHRPLVVATPPIIEDMANVLGGEQVRRHWHHETR